MSEVELLEENKRLKERIKTLETLLNRKSAGHASAYNAIREMIVEKVRQEVNIADYLEDWQKKDTLQKAERQIMSDLKWDLRVRRIEDFRAEHVEPAKEYIENYVLAEELKKSRWG